MLGSLQWFNALVVRVKQEPEGYCPVLDIAFSIRATTRRLTGWLATQKVSWEPTSHPVGKLGARRRISTQFVVKFISSSRRLTRSAARRTRARATPVPTLLVLGTLMLEVSSRPGPFQVKSAALADLRDFVDWRTQAQGRAFIPDALDDVAIRSYLLPSKLSGARRLVLQRTIASLKKGLTAARVCSIFCIY